MAWQRNYVTLKSGVRVRYAFFGKADSAAYWVRFKDIDGRYDRLSPGQLKKVDAIEQGHRLSRERYEEMPPSSETVSWSIAKERLKAAMTADNKRPKTIKGYEETLDRLIEMFPLAKGPGDITDRAAENFK